MKLKISLLLWMLVCLAACKTTTAQTPGTPVAPARRMLVLTADYIPRPDTSLVFVPSGYEKSMQKYPLLYMLHGWSGNYAQWSNLVNLQEYADRYQFVIVCPDGFYDSWYLDSPLQPKNQYEKFFFNDLAPRIHKDYRIDSAKVFITGLSMGGHGAFTFFLKHPDYFLSAGSTSGVLDLRTLPNRLGIHKLIGNIENNDKTWRSYSAFSMLPSIADMNRQLIFDCGMDDTFYGCNQDFRKLCDVYRIKATFIAQPGIHNAAYWKKAIKAHFDFFSQF